MKCRGPRTHIETERAPPRARSSAISAAELPLPTTSTAWPTNGAALRYSTLCSTRPRNASRSAIAATSARGSPRSRRPRSARAARRRSSRAPTRRRARGGSTRSTRETCVPKRRCGPSCGARRSAEVVEQLLAREEDAVAVAQPAVVAAGRGRRSAGGGGRTWSSRMRRPGYPARRSRTGARRAPSVRRRSRGRRSRPRSRRRRAVRACSCARRRPPARRSARPPPRSRRPRPRAAAGSASAPRARRARSRDAPVAELAHWRRGPSSPPISRSSVPSVASRAMCSRTLSSACSCRRPRVPRSPRRAAGARARRRGS